MKKIIFLFCFFFFMLEAKIAQLVKIKGINPSIYVDLVFENGIDALPIDLKVYPKNTSCYLAQEVAEALNVVQKELNLMGFGLLIRDGFRPIWVQKKLWEEILKLPIDNPDDYISNPVQEGGRHTRGTAVDLMIVKKDGSSLPCPPFLFSEESHQNYFGDKLTHEQIYFRELLRFLMIKHGFTPIRCEWWHYDLKNWREYDPLPYDFKDLE